MSSFVFWGCTMKEKIIHYLKELLPYILVLIVILSIKKFAFGTILVNGNSMKDTLHNKDFMILDKMTYRFHKIKRFDIVVVQVGNQKLIKRVIGLPGEVIEYRDNELYVNGEKVEEHYSNRITYDFDLHSIDLNRIPNDTYFVMGDNRTDSLDSRSFGVVQRKQILGKTSFVLFPFSRFGNVE